MTTKSMPFAKFGRVNAATRGKNAENLILIALLEMAGWGKGGVTMTNLPDPERRWNRRSIADWADMFKLHFDTTKRALRGLAEHNLIEKHVLTRKSGEKVLLVRPTGRARTIWAGDGEHSEGDEMPPPEGHIIPLQGGQDDPLQGDEMPLCIESNTTSFTNLPLPCASPAGIAAKEGPGEDSKELPGEDMDKLKKGLDSVASLTITIPVTLKDWEAEKTASGFAQCYLRLAAQKQHGEHAGGGTIKPTVKQSAILRNVFKVAPKGRRLEFLRFVVDNWDVLVKALKEAGQTGKETAEGVTKGGPRYGVEFVAAHRTYLVGQFVKDTALALASKPVAHAQLPATSPKPVEPEELSFTQKMIAKQKAAAAKEAKS